MGNNAELVLSQKTFDNYTLSQTFEYKKSLTNAHGFI